jgi:[ribosomal protein S5]-alanine N-acetyltransferase
MTMVSSVSIEPLSEDHRESVQRYAASKRVSAQCNIPHPYPSDGARAFINEAEQGWRGDRHRVFAALLDGKFAGIASLSAIDKEQGCAELEFWVAAPFWNKGVATDAIALAVDHAQTELGLCCLWSACLATNWPSQRVLKKNDFLFCGHFDNRGDFGDKFMGRRMSRFNRILIAGKDAPRDPILG